ncbi:MAG: phosphoribosylglycinamide formyltransferase [Pseudomonadota bacterium]
MRRLQRNPELAPKIAILISGGGSNMVALIKDMQDRGYAEPSLVISNKALVPGVIKAQQLGVPTEVIPHQAFPKGDGFQEEIHVALVEQRINFICLAGFMQILDAWFVDKWKDRILNIHPSLLPKYKGLNTHQRAIDAGDTEAGCSVHLVTAELDDGPILAQAKVPILKEDTARTLAARVLSEEHKLFPRTLRQYLDG